MRQVGDSDAAPQTVMAGGAHIGDMDLAAGPLLAQTVLEGGQAVLVALTAGERGHPHLSVEEYRKQKLAEGRSFADAIGAELHVFDDLADGFLDPNDEVAGRVAGLIQQLRPDMVFAHWPHSLHRDHTNASLIAERARFLAALPGWGTPPVGPVQRHRVRRLHYTENWEDDRDFHADTLVPISAEAVETWSDAIGQHAFARGETYGFRYIDYYTAQLTMRGCRARCEYAIALSRGDADPFAG